MVDCTIIYERKMGGGEPSETERIQTQMFHIPRVGETIVIERNHSMLYLKVENITHTARKAPIKIFCEFTYIVQKED